MDGKKRIMLIITSMLFIFTVLILLVVSINFKNFSQKQSLVDARKVAELVKDGLTAHMVNGIMDQRAKYLQNIKTSSTAQNIWIFRSKKVIDEFGAGFNNEVTRDQIDQDVIKTGKAIHEINETLDSATLRVTIPYIASSYGTPNCLECHVNAKEGDVLGGITMIFDIKDVRNTGATTLLKIILISLISIILFLIIANKLISPYFSIVTSIQDVLKKAYGGDYKQRINEKGMAETKEVAKWLNSLFSKLEETIGAIDNNIALFVSDRKYNYPDPLTKSKAVIEDLAMLYKFKRTIEHDISKEVIYGRLVKFFKESLNLADISLYEVDIRRDIRKLIYDDTPEKFCDIADTNTSKYCRAYRTDSVVMSDEFPAICQACKTSKEYLCINYPIDENVSIVLNIKPKTKEELHENKKAIGYIRNYLESAKPVLQSRILTEILRESNLKDGLTGLYNRKYLDEFMENISKQKENFGILMIDIDHFKKVNDTYGHDNGDVAIKTLADIMKRTISAQDIIFRFGGEEFVIYANDVSKAEDLAQKIRVAFSNVVFDFNGDSIQKTLSVGVALYPEDSNTAWKAIKSADLALYEAKENGRNQVVRYSKTTH